MFHYKNEIFKTINEYDPHLWIWMGDAAYLDDVPAALCKIFKYIDNGFVDKSDSSMPLEYVLDRYAQTMTDPRKFTSF